MKTQVCLMGGEVMPNVIGVLFDRPHRVVPVVTTASRGQVEAFKRALTSANCGAVVEPEREVPPYEINDVAAVLKQIGAEREGEISVNWTGGTKIMSYAARRTAEEHGWRALYVDTHGLQVMVDEPGESMASRHPIIPQSLGINALTHIVAAGHTVDGAETAADFAERHTPDPRLQRAADIFLDATERESIDLRRLADATTTPYVPRHLSPNKTRALEEARLIRRAEAAAFVVEAVETLVRPFYLRSVQEGNSEFLRSGYLEVFVWNQLKRGGFDQVAWHVQLNPHKKGKLRELDVVVEHDARLLVVECKTALGDRRPADLVEEQYAISRTVGRAFSSWLLYIHQFREDAGSTVESQEERARSFGGALVWRNDLERVHEIVLEQFSSIRPMV